MEKCWNPWIIEKVRKDISVKGVKSSTGNWVDVVQIESPEALSQAIGYLKYNSEGTVLLRGQQTLYSSGFPLPSALRAKDPASCNELIVKVINMSGRWEKKPNKHFGIYDDVLPIGNENLINIGVKQYCIEPLLQHYGVKTTWLDLTDSIPYALYFSLVEYVKEEKCEKSQASSMFNNVRVRLSNKNKEPYSYLYAINIGKLTKPDYRKGIDRHETGWLMDARRAIPSHFIRPHAQHGLLFKPLFPTFSNVSPCFVVFRFKKSDAEKWIGNGTIFKHRSIYPPIRYIHPISGQQEADSGLCQLERSFKKLAEGKINTGNYTKDQVLEAFSDLTNYIC